MSQAIVSSFGRSRTTSRSSGRLSAAAYLVVRLQRRLQKTGACDETNCLPAPIAIPVSHQQRQCVSNRVQRFPQLRRCLRLRLHQSECRAWLQPNYSVKADAGPPLSLNTARGRCRLPQALGVNANPCATVASRVITLAVQAQDAAFVVQRVRDVFVCHVVLVQQRTPTAAPACAVGRELRLQPLACLLNLLLCCHRSVSLSMLRALGYA